MWRRIRSRRTHGNSVNDPGRLSPSSNDPPIPPTPADSSHASKNLDHNNDDAGRVLGQHAPSVISGLQKQLVLSTPPAPQRPRSQDRRDDPLGLTVLYAPDDEHHSIDILFIHGLGGTSLRTWCKNRNLDFLWPQKWLPAEMDLSNARIMTFGYNAHFSAQRQQSSSTIGDFANDLLFTMKYGGEGDVRMGQVPIIIVAHSLGGLVFKKAYIHGQLNQEYRTIVDSIKAVLFLATPHRGADLAETLNRVLSGSIFGHSPKKYIRELARNSPTIEDLNESFRHLAGKLRIFSFYETLGTAIGPVTTMILEKESSLLGYQNETPQPLIADHHDVCKFTSREDPNYKSVRGALRSVVSMLRLSQHDDDGANDSNLEIVEKWLHISGPPEEDLSALRSLRKRGTCEDMSKTSEFGTWLESQDPHILWVSAGPGTGKSVQCSFVIDYLKEQRNHCCYWFFKFGDAQKRSLGKALRSIAYQMASCNSPYCSTLARMAKSGTRIENADATTVWRTLFAPKLHLFDRKTYWVIDGLDETESSKSCLALISALGSVPCKIGVLLFSRPLSTIIQSVERAKKKVQTTELADVDNMRDIRLFLNDEMEDFVGADEAYRRHTIEQIAERAQGNFLWASLVTKRIVDCLRPEDVQRVLEDTPNGMDKLYQRMADAIGHLHLEADKNLSEVLLSWTLYSSRPITIEELSEPYAALLGTVMNLNHTVRQCCAQFVFVDANNQLSLVHHSAREYLRTTSDLPFSLDSSAVNEKLLLTCMKTLCDPSLRTKLRRRRSPSLLSYASLFWAFHLDRCLASSPIVLPMILGFFNGDFPLTWVHYLATIDRLSALVGVSSSLNSFVRRRREADALTPRTQRSMSDLATLEAWAIDLLKLTAKFGSRLIEDPDAIRKCVPALSPENSILHQKYANKSSTAMFVSRPSALDWDDCLARVPNETGRALHIAVSAQYLAVASTLTSGRGMIKLWSNTIFQEQPGFELDEPVSNIVFSTSGALLACYGLDRTYVWDVEARTLISSLGPPHREQALAFQFAPDDSSLVVATNFRHVYRLNLDGNSPAWLRSPSPLLEESVIPDGASINTPSSVAFNTECTQVAVAYRNFPLSVWNLEPPEVIARCRRKRQGQTTSTTWTGIGGVDRIVWHPLDEQVLGMTREGDIFKWGPVDDLYEEITPGLENKPSGICCSSNGLVFATSDVEGNVKIYDYSQMVMVYQLRTTDIIYSIAFSPDSRRFYDLRSSYCNVWEPDCLTRMVDDAPLGDRWSLMSSEQWVNKLTDPDNTRATSMLSFSAPVAQAGSKLTIVAIATCLNNPRLCAYVNDEGTVGLLDLASNTRHVVGSAPFNLGLGHVTLSNDGDYIAFSTHINKVTVRQLDLSSMPEKIKTITRLIETKETDRGRVHQLLLDSSRKRLFVSSSDRSQVLKIDDGLVIIDKPVTGRPARWGTFQDNPDILLAFTGTDISLFGWDDLELRMSFPIDRSQGTLDLSPPTSLAAEVLLPSYRPHAHLLVTSFEEAGQKYLTFLLLDTSVLRQGATQVEQRSPSHDAPLVPLVQIPPSIARHVEQPVGLLRDGRLVFLDENLWVCTAQVWDVSRLTALKTGDSSVTRHFFIPRDWLNSAGMMLCRLQADGTLLCPCKGEMAIIRSDLGTEW